MPATVDYLLLAAMFLLMAIEVRLFSALTRAVAGGFPDVSRTTAYTFLIAYQWALVLAIAASWLLRHQPWSALLLSAPHPWRLAAGLALAGVFVGLTAFQRRELLTRPTLSDALKRQISTIEALAPRTPDERQLWTYVAITAGCCEEFLFRGFLLSILATFIGLVAAVPLAAVLFGLFHAYYGWKGILNTATLGFVLTLIALASASLIPVVVIHATIDLTSGDIAYRVLSRAQVASAATQ